MTEDELDYLTELGNQYYKSFSQLVAAVLSQAPPHLHDEFLAMLEDQSSVHGSAYLNYMTRGKPDGHD